MLSTFLLFKTKVCEISYNCLVYIFHKIFLSLGGGGLKFSNTFIECLWVAPRTLVVMVMSGFTFHLVALSMWICRL